MKKISLDKKFQGTCFGHFFPKHVNMYNKKKGLQKFKICFNRVYTIKFVKIYNLAKKI